MPKFDNANMETHKIGGSNYGFSATRIENLGATEYTLVSLAVDVSGSVTPFASDIEKCIKEIIGACRHSPRADNLLVRLTVFNGRLDEVHGYRPLTECDLDKYTGCVVPGGMTALFDAAHNAVSAMERYGKDLVAQDFDANGIVFVITDGDDNCSTMTPSEIKKSVGAAVSSEALESLRTVLIGVNAASGLSTYLQDLQTKAGFDQYVGVADATEKSLAKLASFVSKSISSQSQSLGGGSASVALTF